MKTTPEYYHFNNHEFILENSNDLNNYLSLSNFIARLIKAVQSVSESKWVVVEIFSISGSTHLYLELIESNKDGKKIAQIRGNLWFGIKNKLLNKFENGTGGEKLRKGLKVLLKLKPQLHREYGLSATVEDIDPAYTLGEAAAKLNAIRTRLKNEGKYYKQSTLDKPTEFTSVAVICPALAAGLGDFKSHADPLEKLNLCKFSYFYATFQGEKTSFEIRSALSQILKKHENSQFDCVVILRGGGSQADLAWLNDYEIASAVSECVLPIFVGVGHERDSTIIDEVANTNFHTPSKVIGYIENTIKINAKEVLEAFDSLLSSSLNVIKLTFQKLNQSLEMINSCCSHQIKEGNNSINQFRSNLIAKSLSNIKETRSNAERCVYDISYYSNKTLEKFIANIQGASNHILSFAKKDVNNVDANLSGYFLNLKHASFEVNQDSLLRINNNIDLISSNLVNDIKLICSNINSQKDMIRDNIYSFTANLEVQIRSFIELIIGLGPKKTLQRGYSITKNSRGKIITRKKDTRIGEILSIQFTDGRVNAEVIKEK